MFRIYLFIGLLLGTLACGSAASTDDATLVRAIEVSPNQHDFGQMAAGDSSLELSFTVSNTGETDVGPLQFLRNGASDFTVDGCEGETLVSPGDSCTGLVTFAPAPGATLGSKSLALLFRDPTASNISTELSVTGEVVTPGKFDFVEDNQHDFGALDIGQQSSVMLTLQNTSSTPTGALAVASISAPFSMIDDQCNSVVLQPSDTCTMEVRFLAAAPIGDIVQTLSITDPSDNGQRIASLSGTTAARITVDAPAEGTVTGAGGMSCPGTCEVAYTDPAMSPLELIYTLSAQSDTYLSEWTGICSSAQSTTCQIVLDGNHSTGVSLEDKVAVAVSLTGDAPSNANITFTPAGPDCSVGDACRKMAPGASASATVPAQDFIRWDMGPCVGSSSNSCSFTVGNTAMTLRASYGFQ